MKPLPAILLSLALIVACVAFYSVFHFDVTWIMVLGTSLWAAFDSSKIQLKRYKSGISYGPIVLFLACALLWIVGFPWYLIMRNKIKTGTAVLKDSASVPAA
jgi:hypothetical protein